MPNPPRYHDQGRGIPVVLIHGFPLDRRIWRGVTDSLSSRCRVIAPDLRGFGESASDEEFSIASLADDVHALLDKIGALPCVLGGLSMGGYVALAFAERHAADLRGLILIDTKAQEDTPEAKRGRDAMIQLARSSGSAAVAARMLPRMLATGALQARPDLALDLSAIMESCPARTIERACAAMRDRRDYVGLLPTLAFPALVIVGESDQISPPELARTMREAIPRSRLAIIQDAGHMAPFERPAEVSSVIQNFIEWVETESANA